MDKNIEYLQEFIRDFVETPEITNVLSELENRWNIWVEKSEEIDTVHIKDMSLESKCSIIAPCFEFLNSIFKEYEITDIDLYGVYCYGLKESGSQYIGYIFKCESEYAAVLYDPITNAFVGDIIEGNGLLKVTQEGYDKLIKSSTKILKLIKSPTKVLLEVSESRVGTWMYIK